MLVTRSCRGIKISAICSRPRLVVSVRIEVESITQSTIRKSNAGSAATVGNGTGVKMKQRFEHMMDQLWTDESIWDNLVNREMDGWELCGVVREHDHRYFYFKRPVEQFDEKCS